MSEMVIKRNGSVVPYDGSKIVTAIEKANSTVSQYRQLSKAKIQAIEAEIHKHVLASPDAVSIEDIQDMVEIGIMEMRGYEVAQKYIRYRYMRNLYRKQG